MIKFVQVGAGGFAATIHGPMLKRFFDDHPGELDLAGICVRTNVAKANEYCSKFGFQRVYTDIDEMIDAEKPDACLVITHIDGTLAAVGRVMERGVPVLMEKPPGKNLTEAKELVAIAEGSGAQNMVAFNRRFALCAVQGIEWVREYGPFERVHALVTRIGRGDEAFVSHASIHAVDYLQMLGDEFFGGLDSATVNRRESLAGSHNFHFDFTYGSGATGRGDLLPNAGRDGEVYTIFGNNAVVEITMPWIGIKARVELWKEGERIGFHEWEDGFYAYGIYQEIEAFISAVKGEKSFEPSVATTLRSVSLAEAIQKGVDWRRDDT